MISPLISHIFQRFKEGPIFIKDIRFFKKLFFLMIIPSSDKQKSFRRYCISRKIRNIEFILNHNSLRHIVQNLITINEFRPGLQIKDPRMNPSLKAIFQSEISRKMVSKKLGQLADQIIISPAISETKVMIPGVDTEVLGRDALYFIDHRRYCFYFVAVYWGLFIFFA